ncbi:MAG: hypothetical protein SAK29_10955 [Scytonema sp. PMC 1069.18]|nr:hypothetical protein [Scytonema sp. PMC 1069.18]MEC4881738.1 hypothetical protein [Scytonema sp. PMC 1070.18]
MLSRCFNYAKFIDLIATSVYSAIAKTKLTQPYTIKTFVKRSHTHTHPYIMRQR